MIAAGVLALSFTAPAAATATETDQEQDGGTVPEQVVAVELPTDVGFDPGGQETDIPFDAPPAPQVQAAPETADEVSAVEEEPAADDDPPTADMGDGSDGPPLAEQLTPPAEPAPVPIAPEPVETLPSPTPPAPVETPAATPVQAEPAPLEEKPALPRKRSSEARAVAPPAAPPVPAPQPSAVEVPPAVTAPAPVRVTEVSSEAAAAHAIQRGDRFHVAERGDSLWSIASDLLGDGASTAEIASKVERLWDLNRNRIQTGDPDLLMTGTKLALH